MLFAHIKGEAKAGLFKNQFLKYVCFCFVFILGQATVSDITICQIPFWHPLLSSSFFFFVCFREHFNSYERCQIKCITLFTKQIEHK